MSILSDIVISDILRSVTLTSVKGRIETISNRPSYGLSFCKGGQITYTLNGKDYVSDKNHAIILPKGQTYSLSRDKAGTFTLLDFCTTSPLCDTFMLIPIKNSDIYFKDHEQIKALGVFKNTKAKQMSIFYNMLSRLDNEMSQPNNILLPALEFLTENFSSPFVTNCTLAEKCNISEVYFRKLFLNQYNTTPKQYIIDLRINKAKQLLADGIFKISAIAEYCGFSNPYHFCRVFKEKTGLTPTEFMKQNKIYML